MNEPVVSKTKFENITDNKFLWNLYASTQILINDNLCLQRQPTSLLEFIKRSMIPGTCATVSSYIEENVNIAVNQQYEFLSYKPLWEDSTVKFISNIQELPQDQIYDNVIATGTHGFKYNTIAEYANNINSLTNIVKKDNGILIAVLPKLHLQYHRLKYQPKNLIFEINKRITANIVDSIELNHNFCLKIQNSLHRQTVSMFKQRLIREQKAQI